MNIFAILRVTNTLLVLMQYVDTLVALLIWLCIAPRGIVYFVALLILHVVTLLTLWHGLF